MGSKILGGSADPPDPPLTRPLELLSFLRSLNVHTVKVGGLRKKSATRPWPHSNQLAQIRVCPGSNHSKTMMASKKKSATQFHLNQPAQDGFQPGLNLSEILTDFKFSAL